MWSSSNGYEEPQGVSETNSSHPLKLILLSLLPFFLVIFLLVDTYILNVNVPVILVLSRQIVKPALRKRRKV